MAISSSPFEVVLFDVGGVLLRLDYRRAFRELGFGGRTDVQSAMTQLGADPDYDAFERGHIDEDTYRRRLEGKLGRSLPEATFRELWNGIVGEPFDGVVDSLTRLRQRARVYALTNSNATHMRSVRERFSWLFAIDGCFSSHELGYRKPERPIFDLTLQRIGTIPSRVLYFDDREENVASARLAGMESILVRESPRDWMQTLRDFRVLED